MGASAVTGLVLGLGWWYLTKPDTSGPLTIDPVVSMRRAKTQLEKKGGSPHKMRTLQPPQKNDCCGGDSSPAKGESPEKRVPEEENDGPKIEEEKS